MADLLFSRPRTPPHDAPPTVEAPQPAPAATDLVTVLACGEAHVASLLALALAALPTPLPRTAVLGAPGAIGWLGPLDAAADGLAAFERSGGRALVVLPARDGRELRALAVAGARHLLWTPVGRNAEAELDAVLDALHFGCAFAQLGWLGADEAAAAQQRARIERWSAAGAERRAAPLGTWRPGAPLPPAVCGFLGAQPAGVRPFGLAAELLAQRPAARR